MALERFCRNVKGVVHGGLKLLTLILLAVDFQKPSHEFLMRASYMEIYNEKIYDLLSKEDTQRKLVETPVGNLVRVPVKLCTMLYYPLL
jgi:hypothetical protein